ncbi:hypothetical protein [Allocoleopsis franciscana]|uniref:Uncharacterized protein n=1 Tax=Allocoleopsis franciscana PCC 7113 TaxID=1173027 RepID=K9WBB4_9CYAN|nr:hypothetical protein [Allocoleopsis franciscana]AFZ16822.1 hypothetical protein Mic7113_0923 [Allocoleopsis franciscana PCC 7113]
MSTQATNISPQEGSEFISTVVTAIINRNQSALNPLLKQVIYLIPAQQPESLRGKIASDLLLQITQELEKSLGCSNHPTIAWFLVYVGLGSSPPEAIQAVQMILDQGFKPFEDFFVDTQGIHFYDNGATPEKFERIPERLSEFTQMTVRVDILEVNRLMNRFNLSEPEARKTLLNLKILEQKMKIPLEQLLSVLDYNDELLQQVIQCDLTGSENNPGLGFPW